MRSVDQDGSRDARFELERFQVREMGTYEWLTRALERQAGLQETAKNSAQVDIPPSPARPAVADVVTASRLRTLPLPVPACVPVA